MSVASLPLIGHLYLPLLLTSLIVGMIILILFEKRKMGGKVKILGKSYTEVSPVSNGVCGGGKPTADATATSDIETVQLNTGSSQDASSTTIYKNPPTNLRELVDSSQVIKDHLDHDKPNKQIKDNSQDSTSSCSSSEEDTARPKRKVSHSRRKHSCGGAKTCSNKKNVTEVIIVTDISDAQLRESSEDLAEKFKTGGLTCTTRPSLEAQQSLLNTEPSQLNLFLVTSHDCCEQLHEAILKMRETRDPTAVFTYSVLCLTDSSSKDICKSAERLSVRLSDLGGTEWLPPTCITYSRERQDSSVSSSHEYTTKVLDKVKKIPKKCCGTSCSSKKEVDIEDLATSLLPVITLVKT